VSTKRVCGVRDHARLLAEELDREGVASSMHWLCGRDGSLAEGRSQTRAWTRALASELDPSRVDAILLHYSVFSYSYRGIPLFVHPTIAALRRTGIPLITIMHEIAFPWSTRGPKGNLWAASQRAVLIEVMRASAAVIVTADFRAQWLSTRRWLPARPIAVAPVFSNLPPPATGSRPPHAVPVLGLFGYTLDPASVRLVLDSVRLLRDRGVPVELLLLGAPGRDSAPGALWTSAAEDRGVGDALSFSGTLSPQELSDALAASDMLLYADVTGPASRKGTLAGSLASGRPLIALRGRRSWSQLLDAAAAVVVARTSEALGDAVQGLLADTAAREALGARGRAFAEQTMGVGRTAEVVRGFLRDVGAGDSS
jgi:glycosyltransferase involved in cell wall biosynthesis